jgi:opacity protein-like surface antigen
VRALRLPTPGRAAAIGFLIATRLSGAAAPASAAESHADSTRVLVGVGIGAGVLDVDLPDPNRPGETFGPSFRLHFGIGYEISRWLGVDAEIGFTQLGGSDSLDAVLRAMGRDEESAFTLVDFGAGVRARWPLAASTWAPFLRAGGGGATFSLSAPGFGTRETDPAWSLSGGLEFLPVRAVILRFEGGWLGHQYQDVTRHHVSLDLVVLYAFRGARLL